MSSPAEPGEVSLDGPGFVERYTFIQEIPLSVRNDDTFTQQILRGAQD